MRKYGDDLPEMSMMSGEQHTCFYARMPALRLVVSHFQASSTGHTHTHSYTLSTTGAGTEQQAVPPALSAAGPEAVALLAEAKMRCGGCGAKVGGVMCFIVLSSPSLLDCVSNAM